MNHDETTKSYMRLENTRMVDNVITTQEQSRSSDSRNPNVIRPYGPNTWDSNAHPGYPKYARKSNNW